MRFAIGLSLLLHIGIVALVTIDRAPRATDPSPPAFAAALREADAQPEQLVSPEAVDPLADVPLEPVEYLLADEPETDVFIDPFGGYRPPEAFDVPPVARTLRLARLRRPFRPVLRSRVRQTSPSPASPKFGVSPAPQPHKVAPKPQVRTPRRTRARLLQAVRPQYPLVAKRRGWEGETLLTLHVDARGRVAKATVARSSGHAILDRAAARCAAAWRFEAATRAGKPIASTIEAPVRFRLDP